MRLLLYVAAAIVGSGFVGVSSAADDLSRPIRVSDNGRFLAQPDGQPFFWLADTAWPLFVRLNREESDHYLKDRAAKGFTVIQAVVMGGPFDRYSANRYGASPLIDEDTARPNPAYFEHLDWVIERAAHYGLRMAMLPTWGLGTISLDDPEKKPNFDVASAEAYGRWIAFRYRDKGIIWVLGGDTTPLWPKGMRFSRGLRNDLLPIVDHRPVYDAMAKGIEKAAGQDAFITFHPCGLSFSGVAEPRTSRFFHGREWLDMNMLQSSHFNDPSVFFAYGFDSGWNANYNYEPIAKEYASFPVRPVIDAETRYEDEPVDVEFEEKKGFWTAYDSRNAAYQALFAGAAGHTYGNNSVHQFYDPTLKPALEWVKSPWKVELHTQGAKTMRHVRALMLSRPYFSRVPDQSIVIGATGEGKAHIGATRSSDGSYLMVYLPRGQEVTVDMRKLSGTSAVGWWYDPRTGAARKIGAIFSSGGKRTFVPPTHGPEEDWVLVLDDADRNFTTPGTAAQ